MADTKLAKIGLTPKEPWAADISYEVLDVTLYSTENGGDGCSYVAMRDNIGVTPGTDDSAWLKLSQAGQSIYDLAVKYHHFDGTEEEFEQQYQAVLQAARDAASATLATNTAVQNAETLRVAAEQGRVSAESARADAEALRASAELTRENNETARGNAESVRVSAESGRATAENGRVSAESGREAAESERASAETSRRSEFESLESDMQTAIGQADAATAAAVALNEQVAGDEADRVAAETARETAESGRVSAESARVTAESGRVTAESGRVSAESARVSAETARVAQASSDHTRAESDHGTAATDHTTAGADHTQAGADHTASETATAAANTAAAAADAARESIQDDLAALGQKIGYYVCSTAAATAAKVVSASGFALNVGGALKINFTNKNTAASPTLNINSTGAVPIRINGAEISALNTWEAGETIGFYYDGTYWQGFHLNEYSTGKDNPEWLEVKTDADGRIIEGLTPEGEKKVFAPTTLENATAKNLSVVESANLMNEQTIGKDADPEWLEVKTDSDGKVVEGVQKDGTKVISKLQAPILFKQQKEIDLLNYLNPINQPTAIVSFVDDDSGKYFADTWGVIMQQTGVRPGIACITGMISGAVPAGTGAYEQMTLTELRGYYDAGLEVYSHSWSHPAFRTATIEVIDEQCRKSRDWLLENGFLRNADTMVYPTGMNDDAETSKKLDVVRRNYKYGVATTERSNGVNPKPIEPLFITRCNADSNTLDYLKERVDLAVAEKRQLVVLTHAYELMGLGDTSLSPIAAVNIQRVVDMINYIKSLNIPIMPLCEAIHQVYRW